MRPWVNALPTKGSQHEDARDSRQDRGRGTGLPARAEVQGIETTAQEGDEEPKGSAMSNVVTYIIPKNCRRVTKVSLLRMHDEILAES